MDPKEEIAALTQELEQANYQYYVLDQPSMEDFEYDRKLRRLEELEQAWPAYAAASSPTKRVGGMALQNGAKIVRPIMIVAMLLLLLKIASDMFLG